MWHARKRKAEWGGRVETRVSFVRLFSVARLQLKDLCFLFLLHRKYTATMQGRQSAESKSPC